jgi:hypothetical protein
MFSVTLALFTIVCGIFAVFISIIEIMFFNAKISNLTIIAWVLSCIIYICISIGQDKEIKELKSHLLPTNILENVEK